MPQEHETPKSTVDWKAANDFFTGKAKESEAAEGAPPEGEQTQGSEQAPAGDGELVDVRIKGRTVRMTREAADAHAEFVRDTRERDGRLGGELSQLRERSARLEGMIETVRTPQRVADDDIKPPRPELAIENYAEYHRQMLTYNATMMQRQQDEIRAEYRQDQEQRRTETTAEARQRAWAEKFYASHPHLNKPHLRGVVLDAYRDNFKEISGFGDDVDEAHERLAELADERVLAIKTDGEARPRSQQANTNKHPNLEGAGTPGDGKTKTEKFVPVSSGSWVANKRRALRGGK